MASVRKSTVFRVTGLSAGQPDDATIALFERTIYDSLSEEERLSNSPVVGLAPSCYEDGGTRVALVEFKSGVPHFLSELIVNPLGEWQVEMEDTDITFDRHFFGFTQLYATPPGHAITADVIAITGLDGHAYGSWRGKGNLGRMWLRDFLSKDLPHCRTMTYGYNSKLSSHGIDTIMDYGREFLEEIKQVRNTAELRERPLVFIAHSFGGIILAHCLIKAAQTSEEDHPTIASLYKATYGILLFGTPHKGLIVDDIEKMLAGRDYHPRRALLQQIDSKSDLLMSQLLDFKNLIRDRKVVSFYETEQTRALEYNAETQNWRRTGNFITAVDTESAMLHLPDHIEEKIPLHVDHSHLVKFDSRSAPGYRSALEKLRQFEKDAPAVISSRFSRRASKPKPLFTVPFKKDENFVGREDIITRMDSVIGSSAFQNHNRIALVGLGGVGKSQIAIQYAYRLRSRSSQIWVFWVHASNSTRFKQTYSDIANRVELPGRDDPKADILRLVFNWLCDEGNGRWLMILDNADDADVFFSRDISGIREASAFSNSETPLASFLPQSSNGTVLITSRNSRVAAQLLDSVDFIIKVEPMEEIEALALVRTRLTISESMEPDATTLVKALDGIPLAITQACAYICTNATRFTVSSYLELFLESEMNQAHLLQSADIGDVRRDPSVSNAVLTTWQISFKQIRESTPAAAELLSFMCVLDRQGIPEFLLHDGTNRLDFEDRLRPLIDFSLVSTQLDNHTFEMHRLVQLATKRWLASHSELAGWERKALQKMARVYPFGEHKNWGICGELLPHSKAILAYMVESKGDIRSQASLLHNTAEYLYTRGEYAAAEEMYRRALEGKEKVLRKEHPDTLASMNNLAEVLRDQGKYDEAEEMHRRTLKETEKTLGKEHPDTLASMNNLALVLNSQGKYDKAEELHRRTLEGREKIFGKEHPDTLASMNNLALVLDSQGKYDKTEELHRRTLEGMEKILGKEHPDTLTSVYCLAYLYHQRNRYDTALELYQRACDAYKRILGPQHPTTVQCCNDFSRMVSEMDQSTR